MALWAVAITCVRNESEISQPSPAVMADFLSSVAVTAIISQEPTVDAERGIIE